MFDRPVKAERSGWRDLAISERHRLWGWNCPATDLDFVEYDGGKAIAVVEYKHECAELAYPNSANVRALRDLADRAGIPFFGVRYAADFSWFKVRPLNLLAFKCLPVNGCAEMRERDYVALLYRLRGRVMPPGLLT